MSSKKNSKNNPITKPRQTTTSKARENLGSARKGQGRGTTATTITPIPTKTSSSQKKSPRPHDSEASDTAVAPFDANVEDQQVKDKLLSLCIRFDIHKPEQLQEILEKYLKKDEGESNQPRETISHGSKGATPEMKHDTLKKSSERLANMEKLKAESAAKEAKITELESSLQDKVKELTSVIKSLEEANTTIKDLKVQKEQKSASKDDTERKLEETSQTKDKKISDLSEKLEAATKLNKDLQDQKDQQRDSKKDTDNEREETVQTLSSEKEQLETQLTSAREKVEELQSELDKAKKEAKKNLDPNTKKLKDEIDQLKNRLSQLAGSKLTEGNPAIADLSDMNRPINLGEKFSELYDNQWTDAFEELQEEKKNEEDVITELVKIVKDAYKFCTDQSEFFHKEMKNLLKHFNMDPEKLPSEVSKHVKDYRKALSVSVVQDIQERFCSEKNAAEGRRVVSYARQCIAVCWFMTVQDPPVFMDADLPDKKAFDNDKYRAYTKTGKKIRYLVWPVLYLHEGGPLLCKGVAQGK